MSRRRLTHTFFLFALPLVVAWFGLSVWSALFLVLAMLLWYWLIIVGGLFAPEQQPAIVLETIGASHYAEKARWCLDRLGIDYQEQQSGGILGVLFSGRTVPRLKFRTGLVRSSIGNSREILRFLWGEYATPLGDKATFLETTPERLELERRIDRYGADLQVWIYYHLLFDSELTLHLWGADHPAVPRWQRALMRPLYPLTALFVRRVFSITDAHYAKAAEHVEQMLADIDMQLADGRESILGGKTINYVDITFASISGLWMQPDNYGGGMAEASRVARNKLPAPMRADIERWIEDYPRAAAFVIRMYEQERLA
jgi:hypothetical protein